MTHEETAKIWQQLSEPAKAAALYLSVTELRTGIQIDDFLEFAGVPMDSIQELVDSGLAETKSRIEIAKEFIEQHPEGAATTDQELWWKFKDELSIAESKLDTTRYRFTSAEVLDFVSDQFGK